MVRSSHRHGLEAVRPVAGQLCPSRPPNVLVVDNRQQCLRRPPEHGIAVADDLSPCHRGPGALDHSAVGPGGVCRVEIAQAVDINVRAAQQGPICRPSVERAMNPLQRGAPLAIDWTGGPCDEVEIADVGVIITGSDRPTDEDSLVQPRRFNSPARISTPGGVSSMQASSLSCWTRTTRHIAA